VAAGLLGALFVGTALLASVAPGHPQHRSARLAGDSAWPPCGSVPGRPVGCWNAASAPVTTAPTSSTTSTRPVTRPCRGADLQVWVDGSQGLGGTTYTALVFKNRSATACTLTGHPRVTFADRSGRIIGHASRTPLIDPPTTPGPGEIAVADLMVSSQDLGGCQPVTPATASAPALTSRSHQVPSASAQVNPLESSNTDCPEIASRPRAERADRGQGFRRTVDVAPDILVR
jgi:hypothetical protein